MRENSAEKLCHLSESWRKSIPKLSPPPLSNDRFRDAVPFSTTGVDFAGPMYVKIAENTKMKVYFIFIPHAQQNFVKLCSYEGHNV